jgi:RHS repeat-associated protein
VTSVGNQIFIGQFYDENTSLNYLNARYYNAGQGQFISQDPSFLAVGDPVRLKEITGQDQRTFLSDPQQVNSTSYGRDNPITMKDPNGNFPFVIAALPWIYAAYTASQTAVDYYDYRNMNVTYANYVSRAKS